MFGIIIARILIDTDKPVQSASTVVPNITSANAATDRKMIKKPEK